MGVLQGVRHPRGKPRLLGPDARSGQGRFQGLAKPGAGGIETPGDVGIYIDGRGADGDLGCRDEALHEIAT